MSLTKKIFVAAAILGFAITTTAATNSTATTLEDNTPKTFMDKVGFTAYLFAYDVDLSEWADDSAGSSDQVYGRLLGKYQASKSVSLRAGFNYSFNFDEDVEERLEDPILEARWSGKLGRASAMTYLRSYIGASDNSQDDDLLTRMRHVSVFTLPTTISPSFNATFATRAEGYIYEDSKSDKTSGNEYRFAAFPGLEYSFNDNFTVGTSTNFYWTSTRADSTLKRADLEQTVFASMMFGKVNVYPYLDINPHDISKETSGFGLDVTIPVL